MGGLGPPAALEVEGAAWKHCERWAARAATPNRGGGVGGHPPDPPMGYSLQKRGEWQGLRESQDSFCYRHVPIRDTSMAYPRFASRWRLPSTRGLITLRVLRWTTVVSKSDREGPQKRFESDVLTGGPTGGWSPSPCLPAIAPPMGGPSLCHCGRHASDPWDCVPWPRISSAPSNGRRRGAEQWAEGNAGNGRARGGLVFCRSGLPKWACPMRASHHVMHHPLE